MALQLQRTANAGVLLNMDGVSILLDGVCGEIFPYLPTPEPIRAAIQRSFPDMVAYTHAHGDHYDHAFTAAYAEQTLRPVFGPEVLPCGGREAPAAVKGVKITPIPTRHIGKFTDAHTAFLLEGSQCILFTGDASPSQWQKWAELPKADVMIAPFAYALTSVAWKHTCDMAKAVVLLHMPDPRQDPMGLWPQVQTVLAGSRQAVYIPEMGQQLHIP